MGLIEDSLEFSQESTGEVSPWKILIVDDEPEVHHVTRLVLGNFRFADRPVQLISAYSSVEAEQKLRENTDTAVILLDVVMETRHTGASCPWKRSTVPTRIADGSAARSAFTWAL